MLGILCVLLLLTSCSDKDQSPSTPPLTTSSTVTPQSDSMETLQALSAPKGLNTKRLFAEPVSDQGARFNRLEREVQDLRDDFDIVSPAITRLVAVEEDMRDLMDQLETLVAADSANDQIIVQNVPEPMAVPPLAPAPAQAPILTTAPTPVTQPLAAPTPIDTATAASIVKDLRIGEHTDKTRLVLDMTAEVPYKATLNADGMGVVLILPNTAWSTDQSWSSNVSPMVKSYKATPAPNGGTRLDIAFTEKASLKYNSYIKPRNGMSRLVIDLFSSELHLAQ